MKYDNFTIFPAIDIKNGCCVRLRQGLPDEATVYGEDPLAMALHWRLLGARALHVVDLDGAFSGRPVHTGMIGRMAQSLDIPLQVGGGLRSDEDMRRLLDLGVARVVIGTRALNGPEEIARLAGLFGDKLVVGIDARDGMVQVRGWQETTNVGATVLAGEMAANGVRTLIYTDTGTDGMLTGPNLPAISEFSRAVSCHVVASGGVSRLDDLTALANLRLPNLQGVIVGKALYEKRFDLKQALALPGAEDSDVR